MGPRSRGQRRTTRATGRSLPLLRLLSTAGPGKIYFVRVHGWRTMRELGKCATERLVRSTTVCRTTEHTWTLSVAHPRDATRCNEMPRGPEDDVEWFLHDKSRTPGHDFSREHVKRRRPWLIDRTSSGDGDFYGSLVNRHVYQIVLRW